MIIYTSPASYPNVSNYITAPCIVSLLWKSIFSVLCDNTPTWLIIVSFHKCWLPSRQPQIPHGHVTSSTTDPRADLAGVEARSGSFDLTGLQLSWTQRWGPPACPLPCSMPALAWMYLGSLVATFTSQLNSITLPANLHVNSVSHSPRSEKRGRGGPW